LFIVSQTGRRLRRALWRGAALLIAVALASSVVAQPRAALAMAAQEAGHGAMAMGRVAAPVGAAATDAHRAPARAGMPDGCRGCCGCLAPCCAGCASPAVPVAAVQPPLAALEVARPAAPGVVACLVVATPHRQPLPTGPPSAPLA